MSDIVISKPALRIPKADYMAAMEAEFEAFHGEDYEHLFESSERLVRDGDESAYYLPVASFMLNASLRTLNEETVTEQLPDEVWLRGKAGMEVADAVGDQTVLRGYFRRGYWRKPLQGLVVHTPVAEAGMREYLKSLSKGPFEDSRRIAGGALRLLQVMGVEGSHREIIKRSIALLAIAKLDKLRMKDIHEWLGPWYVQGHHYGVDHTNDGVRLRFTRVTLEEMARINGDVSGQGGCPAGKIKASQGGGSLLQQDWGRLVDFLVPPTATADGYHSSKRNWLDLLR